MEATFPTFEELLNYIVNRLAEKVSCRLKDDMPSSPAKQTESDLIYKQDAMGKYHFSASTAWHWQQQGRVKPYKIGRKVFYRESDIRRAMGIKTEE
ncbi:MAG: helix-turn-helix domain-containing protein [Prevotella sp.]|jgi:predicted DNA-binding transcriptional regulator AlpA|nr:helix-turn-helix domain-containing protein [Prevotella sp.]